MAGTNGFFMGRLSVASVEGIVRFEAVTDVATVEALTVGGCDTILEETCFEAGARDGGSTSERLLCST